MEATLGISLYTYLYLKLAKTLCLSIIAHVFSSAKLEKRAEQVLLGSQWGGGGTQIMYTHVSNVKMIKIKNIYIHSVV
jgi:hypothetical protein